MTGADAVLARSIDELVEAVPGVVLVYSAAPPVARAARRAQGRASARSAVTIGADVLRAEVHVGVDDSHPAAETAARVGTVVRQALLAREEATGPAAIEVRIRVAAVTP